MIVSRKRVALFLALALPALLVAGAGSVLCIDADGQIALEQAAQICCPSHRIGTQRAFSQATDSSGAHEVPDADCCIYLPLVGSIPAVGQTSDARVSGWLQTQVFAGASLSPGTAESVLPSFTGRGRAQWSTPSHLFARTISLRC
jgi:hypothetical protein